MFARTSRIIARSSASTASTTSCTAFPLSNLRSAGTRRFLGSSAAAPDKKKGSWKGTVLRWGAAAALVYAYQTSDVFKDAPDFNPKTIPDTADETESKLPTLEVLEQQRLERKKVEAQLARQAQKEKYLEAQRTQKAAAQGEQQPPAEGEHQDGAGLAADAEPGSVEALEEEAGQQGAFNPETGEINWDCPCLGGMANGPCGEEFKAAFSCFVYSTEEPKGMDCIEKFKDMQTCFRAYPDIYGAELQDQDDDDDVSSSEEHPAAASPSPIAAESDHSSSTQATRAEKVSDASSSPAPVREAQHERAEPATAQLQRQHQPLSSSENVVPKPWHDAEDKK